MEWRGAQLNGCQFTHGMIHNVMYTGVPLKILLEEAGLKPNAKWLLLEGGDAAAMTRSLPLAKALDDCLVAYRMNGEMLRPENGYPVRMVVPGWEANMWVKWLRRIEVGDQPWHHREETSKYTDLLENGRARRFTYVMDAKSVITSPSPQAPLRHGKGFTVVTGLAWSGRGKIARVDLSLDGGRNWRTARLDGPVLDKSMARFYAEFEWDGREMLLQSRAMDDTGYVQPTKDELRKVRGLNSIYHNNGIQTWRACCPAARWKMSRSRKLAGALLLAGARRRRHRLCRHGAKAGGEQGDRGAAARRAGAHHYGIGREARPEEIAGWDIDIRPDGQGLPKGRGTARAGEDIFVAKCAACPRRVRREHRPLAGAGGRRRLAGESRSGEDHRLVLAICLDGDRLHPPRHAVRRRPVAPPIRASTPSPPISCSSTTSSPTATSCCRTRRSRRSSCRTRRTSSTTTAR